MRLPPPFLFPQLIASGAGGGFLPGKTSWPLKILHCTPPPPGSWPPRSIPCSLGSASGTFLCPSPAQALHSCSAQGEGLWCPQGEAQRPRLLITCFEAAGGGVLKQAAAGRGGCPASSQGIPFALLPCSLVLMPNILARRKSLLMCNQSLPCGGTEVCQDPAFPSGATEDSLVPRAWACGGTLGLLLGRINTPQCLFPVFPGSAFSQALFVAAEL